MKRGFVTFVFLMIFAFSNTPSVYADKYADGERYEKYYNYKGFLYQIGRTEFFVEDEIVYGEEFISISGYDGRDKNLIIPDTIEGIKVTNICCAEMFGGYMGKIESIYIPKYILDIDISMINSNSKLRSIEVSSENENYTSVDGVLYSKDMSTVVMVPPSFKEYTFPKEVNNIGYLAFSNTQIKEIYIPENISCVETGAFANCCNLEKITFAGDDILFMSGVFDGCKNLKEVILPKKLSSISSSMFGYCESLESIVIPESVEEIQEYAFSNCTSLEKLKLNNVNNIGIFAFANCTSLKEITFSKSIQSIGERAFSNCTSLENINFNFIYEIGNNAFENCTSLKEITLPYSLTTIGNELFSNCIALEKAIVNSSIIQIPSGMFYGCKSLKEVTLPNVTIIGSKAFSGCERLKYIELPETLNRIYTYAFSGCKSLNKIKLPQKLERIFEGAFMGCDSLTTIEIPSSVQLMSKNSFGFDDDESRLDILIIGEPDSTAEKYAKKNNIKFYSGDSFNYLKNLTPKEKPTFKQMLPNIIRIAIVIIAVIGAGIYIYKKYGEEIVKAYRQLRKK